MINPTHPLADPRETKPPTAPKPPPVPIKYPDPPSEF